MTIGKLLTDLTRRGVHLWVEGDRLHFSAQHAEALNSTLREAISNHRDELLDLLAAVGPTASLVPLTKAPAGVAMRCSHAQERFLFSAELDGSSNPYRLDSAFRILGPLDIAALDWSIREIVRRHEILRSRFDVRDGGFLMVPTSWEPVLETVTVSGSEADLVAAICQDQLPEFDLRRGPHLFVKLYRLSSDHHVLLVCMHHLVSDGGSIGIFADELQRSYAWRMGLAAERPPYPELQFCDVASAEHTVLEGEQAEHLDFWKRELESAPAVLSLPTDGPRPAIRTGDGSSVPLDLDATVWHRLQQFRKVSQLSEFQIVVAALWLLLHKYSGQEAIVIGTPWRNRERPGSEKVIGPLLNVLPLHIRPRRDATIRELLVEVKTRTLAAVGHGSVPFEQVVSHLRPERSTAYTPIFQVMCAIEPTPGDAVHLAGLAIEPIVLPNEAARYDLAVVLRSVDGTLQGAFKYDRALFEPTTARRMARHFVAALKLLLDEYETPISQVQLMSETERQTLLHEWNRTEHNYPLDRTLVDFLHDRVAASPDGVAVEYEGRSLSYSELNRWSNRVAHRLLGAGVGTDDIVGITLDRSLELVVAIVGVLKAGAAYLPVDSKQPPERRAWMLENAGVKAVIGSSLVSVPQIFLGEAPDGQDLTDNPGRRPQPNSACYIIYTSGSTGLPKGVVVDHRAIANNLLWMNAEWPLTEQDAVLFKSSPGFDVSVKEIFWPLMAGARLVIAPPGVSGDPEQLYRIIRSSRISVVHMVPTLLDYFLRHEAASPIEHLRIVMCGGEALSPALRSRFHKSFDAILLHLYGPTEAAIAVTGYAISAQHAEVERLPLGRPMPNCRIYVLDEFLQPVPIGVSGELCIAGIPLARGYLGRPDLTAEKFIPDPFTGDPGSRMYLTGDRARWRPAGQVEYLGRIDRQIKLGGFRMEPGEIEAVLRMQEGVDDALVVLREADGNRALVAYVTSRSAVISAGTLQRELRTRLPSFMVPSTIIILPAFPTNVNGKVDAAALPLTGRTREPVAAKPPEGELEREVSRVWCEILNLETADRDEDFFNLGGHSLLILQLQAKLRDSLGETVSVADLFLHNTVASLTAHLSESKVRRTKRWLRQNLGIGKSSAS